MHPSIFISYRRSNSKWAAKLIHDTLAQVFTQEKVLKDQYSIDPDRLKESEVQKQVAAADVVLVVMGPEYVTLTNPFGQPQLWVEGDYAALEVQKGFALDKVVVPVLLDHRPMPEAEDLPPGIRKLVESRSFKLSVEKFDKDMEALIHYLKKLSS